jgi:hypothetical protein
MEHYVGLDVSLKLTTICIVDQSGKIVREGMVPPTRRRSRASFNPMRRMWPGLDWRPEQRRRGSGTS